MGFFDDRARPRFVRVTQRVRAEIDYSTGTPEVVDVVGLDRVPLSAGRVIQTARALGWPVTTEVGALRVIARLVRRRRAIRRAIEAARSSRAGALHLWRAEQWDVDADLRATDPDAPDCYRLTGADVDSLASEYGPLTAGEVAS